MWGAHCGVHWPQPSSIAGRPRHIARPAKHFGLQEPLVLRPRLRKADDTLTWPRYVRPLLRFLRDTSHQLIQSREEELQDGRLVRLSIAKDQIDGRSYSFQGATRYRRKEKILCVRRKKAHPPPHNNQDNPNGA